MSKEFWDQRYSEQEFVYGKDPNAFLREELINLSPGNVFFLGEGEGRNAVFAAKLGWVVDAVDQSEQARRKALMLADESDVNINYLVSDITEFKFQSDHYDLIVSIFFHLPIELRKIIYPKIIKALKPNGKFLLEAFGKNQLNYSSGGPKDHDLLCSEEEVAVFFKELNTEMLETKIVDLSEGKFHYGDAEVVRYIGVKA